MRRQVASEQIGGKQSRPFDINNPAAAMADKF
jgi:hypothetical protein